MDETDSVRDLLVRGVAAAKAGAKDEARFFLEWVLRSSASEEAKTDAYWWLSQLADDPAEARRCLEEVLARNLTHPQARRALAVLDGRLKLSAVVDPDHLPPPSEERQSEAPPRFACPRCGGRPMASADGVWLRCDYCGWQRSVDTGETAPEQDFVVAMATAHGHRHPQRTRTFRCRGCGAPYMLGPELLTFSCPYCAATHAVAEAASEELIPPDGFLPFASLRPESRLQEGARRIETWLGLYLPLWAFDLSGEVPWTGVRQDDRGRVRETVTGSVIVLEKDHLVLATRRFPEAWAREALDFTCAELRPFRVEALVGWPAETYQVSMSDAAIAAHAEVFAAARQRALAEIPPGVEEVRFDSTRFSFDSFQLILAPVWLGLSGGAAPRPVVVVNGQTGKMAAARGEK